MEHWVEFPPEPSELVLSWRAPEHVEWRTRWAVGVLRSRGSESTFRYLEGSEFEDANLGRNLEQLKAIGFRGYPAFEQRHGGSSTFSGNVLEAFARRLPPLNRPDFPQYLELYRYRGRPLPAMSLLALTGARLPSDGFSLVDRLDPSSPACDIVIEVMGFRHQTATPAGLELGAALDLVAEPDNSYDADAIRIQVAEAKIGYVNRLQSRSIAAWLQTRSVSCWLLRKNERPQSPTAFALLQMRTRETALAA